MALARIVTQDTELDGYLLRKGSVCLFPVRLLHYDEQVFPDAESFLPERWIGPEDDSSNETKSEFYEQEKKQKASLRTFGGGVSICAGRFAAEKEILSTVAAILLLFDIEAEEGGAISFKGKSQGDLRVQLDPQSVGIMNPKGKTPIRMRRRNPREPIY